MDRRMTRSATQQRKRGASSAERGITRSTTQRRDPTRRTTEHRPRGTRWTLRGRICRNRTRVHHSVYMSGQTGIFRVRECAHHLREEFIDLTDELENASNQYDLAVAAHTEAAIVEQHSLATLNAVNALEVPPRPAGFEDARIPNAMRRAKLAHTSAQAALADALASLQFAGTRVSNIEADLEEAKETTEELFFETPYATVLDANFKEPSLSTFGHGYWSSRR